MQVQVQEKLSKEALLNALPSISQDSYSCLALQLDNNKFENKFEGKKYKSVTLFISWFAIINI